jgi:uncharacterized YccA/Bax inhibitor family protein
MDSRNPVLNREFGEQQLATFHEPPPSAAQLQEMYDGPTTTSVGRRMTIDDVVVRSGVLFVILVAGAFAGWQVVERAAWVVWVCALIAFGLALAATFTREAKPALILLYAAFEGLFLGGISRWYDVYVAAVKGTQTGIVQQAIIGTLVAFAVMLVLYTSGRLRATARFQKIMLVALVSYGAIALVSFIGALFGLGGGWGFYGVGTLGLLLCAAGVALASFTLVLDFDAIQRGVEAGWPERESWRAAFGLMVTLVWLYLELLRFLAILNSRN